MPFRHGVGLIERNEPTGGLAFADPVSLLLNPSYGPPSPCAAGPFAARLSSYRLLLTHRTEERRSPVLHDPLDGAAASWRHARFTLTVIDAETMLEIAKLAIGLAVIAQRRSAPLDGVAEHRLDGVDQGERPGVRRASARRPSRG